MPWLDTDLFPFRRHPIDIEGDALGYVDEGQGPPIVFVHGTPSWSFEWRHCIAALSARHRWYAEAFGHRGDRPAAPGLHGPEHFSFELLRVPRPLLLVLFCHLRTPHGRVTPSQGVR